MEILKKHIITISLSLLVVAWTFVKDLIATGADSKFNESVVLIVKGEQSTKYINTLIREAIDTEMNDPFALIDILSSEHVNKFAETKAIEVKEAVKKELFKSDSIKGDLIHELGTGTGMRNEDILPELIQMLKDFKAGKLSNTRTVRGNF